MVVRWIDKQSKKKDFKDEITPHDQENRHNYNNTANEKILGKHKTKKHRKISLF